MLTSTLRSTLSSTLGALSGDDSSSEDTIMDTLQRLVAARPGPSALPILMSSPPTMALSAAGAATGIASSVRFRMDCPSAFRYFGVNKPVYSAGTDAFTSTGKFTNSTDSPWAVEFTFITTDSTGRFEILMVGKNAAMRLLVNGQYASSTPYWKPTSDGGLYRGLVTLGAAGTYRIRIEMDAGGFFRGINAGPTDTIRATAPKSLRVVFAGDSYTEPTISDTNVSAWDGFVQKLSYLWDADCVSCGVGGTGYVATNSGTKLNLYDRRADIIALNPNILVVPMGLNDFGFTYQQIFDNALQALQAFRNALPTIPIIVTSPFYKAGFFKYPAGLLACRDAIKAAAALVSGTKWIDSLTTDTENVTLPAATTLSADTVASGTSISLPIQYALNTYVTIGNVGAQNREVRMVTSVTGSGPYVHNFNGTSITGGGSSLTSLHFTGEAVTPCGKGILDGDGKLGATTGNGNSDFLVGTDATHPAIPGGQNIADWVDREVVKLVA